MKDAKDWYLVRRLYQKGMKIKEIARELGMSKNTVKKLINSEEPPKYTRAITSTKIDCYKDKIGEMHLEEGLKGTEILKELNKLGYEGGIGPIYRYINTLKNEVNNSIPEEGIEDVLKIKLLHGNVIEVYDVDSNVIKMLKVDTNLEHLTMLEEEDYA
ncbi:MAG: helix-turn-helix domain-containing protein [Bacillota bacterium]|nr:helix-turn-helix domain-containing protein [Bacillota bacterium]